MKVGLFEKTVETIKLSCKWLYSFAFPPAINESPCCSTSSLVLGNVRDLDFSHSNIWGGDIASFF